MNCIVEYAKEMKYRKIIVIIFKTISVFTNSQRINNLIKELKTEDFL